MSRIIPLMAALMILAMAMARSEEVEEELEEGRTFGLLAKPLKKLTNKFGHYLVHATSDYHPQYYSPVDHLGYGPYGGYGSYGGYSQYGHRPTGYVSGFL